MQELDRFNLKIKVIPNGLQKYMSFTISNKLSFIGSFQFYLFPISSSLDSLVKNLSKDDFNYLSQGLDNNASYLIIQKWFYLYEYMSDFVKFKEKYPSNTKDVLLTELTLTDRNITGKCEHVLNVWSKFEMKTIQDYYDFYLKCDIL